MRSLTLSYSLTLWRKWNTCSYQWLEQAGKFWYTGDPNKFL